MSEAQKGHKVSEKTKLKMSEAKSGKNNPMFGKHHLYDTRQKLYNIGENNPMFGKHHSENAKKKISEAHKGNYHTEEAKLKMRKPKNKFKWKTLNGEIKEMSAANVAKWHPEWIKIN